ncbi:MAG: AarF/ABC1/UbiB kinase family protein [Tepidanaerobacteraceae bacterium]|jgi:ubiquinone biosynthesis protein|nr:AarF/ABC1/UbiB kinase family protein [Tepidanaerobacteraceae bacterium]
MGFYTRYRNIRRVREIANVLIKNGFGLVMDKIGLFEYFPLKKRKTSAHFHKDPVAVRVRHVLEELGPTFIKLGQMLSTRKDIVPGDILIELEKLQDEVKPFSTDEARSIVSEELANPIGEIFDAFSEEPIASASIGQVYRARLVTGEDVIVKVKRPHIEEMVAEDLDIILDLATILEQRFEWARMYGLVELVEEFSNSLMKEMDFSREGRNAERLRKCFEGSKEVYIPQIFWKYTTSRVLTQEYISGIKVTDIEALIRAKINSEKVAGNLASCYIKQIVRFGFFHADPHPGNIIVLNDGKIGLLDFGMVGTLREELKKLGVRLMIAVIDKDSENICKVLLEMGIARKMVNREELKSDIEHLMSRYYDVPFKEISVGDVMTQMLEMARKYQIKVPSELALLAKTLITLEGILAMLAPNMSIVEIAEPYVKEAIRRNYSIKGLTAELYNSLNKIRDYGFGLPRHSLKVLEMIERGEIQLTLKHEKLDRLISRLDIISNRLAFSIIVASLIMGSSLMADQSRRLFLKMPVAELGFVIAGFMGFWLLISIMKSGRF